MKTYSTLILDAFNTLVHVDLSKLVEHRAGERTIRTTAPKVHEFYEEAVGQIQFERFLEAFLGSMREANRRRRQDHREIPSADRFALMLDMLGEAPSPELAGRLAEAHMRHLAPALTIHDSQREVLSWSNERGYRLAIVSNFDYAPTLHRCLEQHGVRDMFDAVVVSDQVGWRKPHPAIFEHAFRKIARGPEESLFVGDRLDLDVDGAAGVGMDVAWIDTGECEWTPEFAEPQYRIRSLADLIPILQEVSE